MSIKKFFLFAFFLPFLTLTTHAQQSWVGSWATAVEYTGEGDMPSRSLSNRSCRQVIHVSLGGSSSLTSHSPMIVLLHATISMT